MRVTSEKLPHLQEVLKWLFPDTLVYGDYRSSTGMLSLSAAQLYCDGFVVTPSCQAFSKAGRSLGRKDKRSNDLLDIVDYVNKARPLTVCVECTPEVVGQHIGVYKELLERMRLINYHVVLPEGEDHELVMESRVGGSTSRTRWLCHFEPDWVYQYDLPPLESLRPVHEIKAVTVAELLDEVEDVPPELYLEAGHIEMYDHPRCKGKGHPTVVGRFHWGGTAAALRWGSIVARVESQRYQVMGFNTDGSVVLSDGVSSRTVGLYGLWIEGTNFRVNEYGRMDCRETTDVLQSGHAVGQFARVLSDPEPWQLNECATDGTYRMRRISHQRTEVDYAHQTELLHLIQSEPLHSVHGVSPSMRTWGQGLGGPVGLFLITRVQNGQTTYMVRQLTIAEQFKVQGIPLQIMHEVIRTGGSKRQLRQLCGNTVAHRTAERFMGRSMRRLDVLKEAVKLKHAGINPFSQNNFTVEGDRREWALFSFGMSGSVEATTRATVQTPKLPLEQQAVSQVVSMDNEVTQASVVAVTMDGRIVTIYQVAHWTYHA